jgi:hypothetical protein
MGLKIATSIHPQIKELAGKTEKLWNSLMKLMTSR